jgi:16S rRNA (uracil1498-N3)-methyltransferase
MSAPRFHVAEAAPGAHLELPEHSAHHARDVLRLRAGDEVRVFDGRGGEYEAALDEVSRGRVTARLSGLVVPRPESPLFMTLALSPLKGDRMELVVQKATELGVSAIQPVILTRTDAVARPALKGTRHDRWEKVASGAAEQCGRATVPEIHPARLLGEWLREELPERRLVFCEGKPPLGSAGYGPALVLLVGPAGGIEESELLLLREHGFEERGLGPRTLRAETAAIAAVCALQLLAGDLGS